MGMGCFLFSCFGSSKPKHIHHQNPKPHLITDQQSSLSLQRNLISGHGIGQEQEHSSFYSLQHLDFNKPLRPVLEDEHGNKHVLLPHEEADSVLAKKEDENLAKVEIESSSEDFVSHRYKNCRDSDDEGYDEVLDSYHAANHENDESGSSDFDDDFGMLESNSEVSLSTVAVFSEEVDGSISIPEIGLNRTRQRTAYICPVLNPVENLPQWNALKLKGTLPPIPQKENMSLEQDSPFSCPSQPKTGHPTKLNQEMAVDASLSNWLVPSETTPVRKSSTTTTTMASPSTNSTKTKLQGSSSRISREDRLISGALTDEELKLISSSTNSPRKSPSRSPDEMPIIGTVGTYWSHTVTNKQHDDSASSFKGIPNTTSKYREDKTVNWHSTPFETRLERALKRGVSKA